VTIKNKMLGRKNQKQGKKSQNEAGSHVKPLRFVDLEFGETGSPSIEVGKLRPLALETEEQRTALSQLIPKGKFNGLTEQFQNHVLRLLALVVDKMRVKRKIGVISQRSPETVRKFRDRAKRVRSFVRVLEPLLVDAIPNLPVPPIDELRHYAQELDRRADSIQLGPDGLLPPLPGAPKSKKRPLRRTKAIGNLLIVYLVELVLKVTGEDHYDELTILLRRATGDPSYNNHRLQSLCWVDRKNKKKRGRMAALFARNRVI